MVHYFGQTAIACHYGGQHYEDAVHAVHAAVGFAQLLHHVGEVHLKNEQKVGSPINLVI